MTKPCPCLSGYGPSCHAEHPTERMLTGATGGQTWVICTLSEHHDGDHVYCGGQVNELGHRMFVWPREEAQ